MRKIRRGRVSDGFEITYREAIDLSIAADMAAIAYERLARESGTPEVMAFFVERMRESQYLARQLREEDTDMATPARYV